MSCPTEGIESAAFGNNIDSIKDAIELKHGRAYRIYNLANKAYRKEKFSQQVLDLGAQLASNKAPPISLMVKLCGNVCKYLSESAQNVVVINCNDGKNISCVAVTTLMLYCGVVKSVDAGLSAFVIKRGQVMLTPSQIKFLKYTHRLFVSIRNAQSMNGFRLAPNECILTGITLLGVPMFNRQRWKI